MAAKLAQYDILQQKVNMMEEDLQNGRAATSILKQFIDEGIAQQDEEGHFFVPGSGNNSKFKPFDNQ